MLLFLSRTNQTKTCKSFNYACLGRQKEGEGIPPPYDRRKRVVVPGTLRVICLKPGHKLAKKDTPIEKEREKGGKERGYV